MKARVAVLISGAGTNMAALIYAAKQPGCPFEIVLVASNNPQAEGLKIAAVEGIETFAHPHLDITRAEHDSIMHDRIVAAAADHVALAGYMRILSEAFVEKWESTLR